MSSSIALLPQMILLGTALMILVIKIISRQLAHFADYVGIAGGIAALVSLFYVPTGLTVAGFIVDSYGLFGTGLLIGTYLGVMLYSLQFLRRMDLPPTEWTFLLLCAVLGLSLMFNTHNLLLLFIGLELSSLAFYVLCGYLRTGLQSLEPALKYFIIGSVGSAVLLLGIAFVFINQQTIIFSEFSIASGPELTGFTIGLGVVLLGFLFKLSMVPLHFWVPDVYEGAPTPVTAFMSVAVKIGVLGALIRFFSAVGGLTVANWLPLFWWGAVITIVGGNLLALVQDSLKRMLAYSSIAHAGYLMMGLVTFDARGYSAILFYLVVYFLMNVMAFGVISLIESEDDQYLYSDLTGLSQTNPLLAGTLAISMISLSGLPPTAGFMGKLFLFYGVIQADFPLLAVIAVLGSIVSVAYYFRVIVYSYMRTPGEGTSTKDASAGVLISLTVSLTALAILVLGVNPTLIYDRIFQLVDGLQSTF